MEPCVHTFLFPGAFEFLLALQPPCLPCACSVSSSCAFLRGPRHVISAVLEA